MRVHRVLTGGGSCDGKAGFQRVSTQGTLFRADQLILQVPTGFKYKLSSALAWPEPQSGSKREE